MIPLETKTEKQFTLVPAGNHIARIYSIIHIGHILQDTQWGPRNNNKLRITWELPNERKEFKEGDGEKPLSISSEYNISYGEKAAFRQMLDGLLGKGVIKEGDTFDIESLLGRACMVNVQHTAKGDKTYANVVSVAPLPKGMPEPEPFNQNFILNYNDNWSDEAYEKLPDYLKNKMAESDEYKLMKYEGEPVRKTADPENEIDPDDIPF
jgi:hypothetical protein